MAEKPRRATLIIIRNDRVLLARDDTLDYWSLPGGRIEPGELDEAAAARELNEETGLKLLNLEYLLDHESDVRHRRVFTVTVNDAKPAPGNEIAELKWWDGREPIKQASSVTPILSHPVIAFGHGEKLPMVQASQREGRPLEMLFSIEENTWKGRTTLQLRARDLRTQEE